MSRAMMVLVAVASCSSPRPARVIAPSPPGERPLVVPQLSEAPVDRLPRTFEPKSYAARLHVDPGRVGFVGSIEITGDLAEPSSVIWLNAESLTVHFAWASRDGKRVPLVARMKRGYLALQPEQPLAAGRWTIGMTYNGAWNHDEAWGGFRQGTSDGWYVFTQFEPDYARRVFPCIDEPDRKVPWQLTLVVPDGLVAASNAPIARETTGPQASRTIEFAPTLPLPSYLVAFAVGPFDVVDAGRSKSGVPIRVMALRGKASDAKGIADATPRLLDEIATYLDVPCPYPKLDIVAVPRTGPGWGAMENAGLITMSAEAFSVQHDWYLTTLAHELAHHWFGNLVTMAWWDDLWLNEAFATWLAAKLVDNGRVWREGAGTVLLPGKKPRAERGDWGQGARVIQAFEGYVGDERFRTALRRYLTSHAHGIVRTSDFASALGEVAGENLTAAVADQLAEPRDVWFELEAMCTGTQGRIEIRGANRRVPFCFAYERNGTRRDRCLIVDEKKVSIELDRCPRWILPLPLATSQAKLDATQIEHLATRAWQHLAEAERLRVAQWAITTAATPARLQWSMIEMLASSTSTEALAWLVDRLANIDEVVPANRLVEHHRWIRSRLGALARRVGFESRPGEDRRDSELRVAGLPELVARAGDAALVAEAIGISNRADRLIEYQSALRARARVDRSFAEQLVVELLATSDAPAQYRLGKVLEAVPDRGRIFVDHLDQIRNVHSNTVFTLLFRDCALPREEAAKLWPHASKVRPTLDQMYDHCARDQAARAKDVANLFSNR